jgi:hypothetical protein
MADEQDQLTFEQIDAHIKKANLKDFQPGGQHHFTAAAVAGNPAGVLVRSARSTMSSGRSCRASSSYPSFPPLGKPRSRPSSR